MDNNTPPVDQEETIKKIEAIYDETMAKIKTLEDEQKKIISEYIRKLEQNKIEHIIKTLMN